MQDSPPVQASTTAPVIDSSQAIDQSSIGEAGNATSLPEQLTEVYHALMKGELTEATSSLLLRVILPGVIALAVLVVVYLIAKLLSRWVSAFLCDRFDRTIGIFGGKLTFYTIMIFAGLAVLQTMGVGITAFAAVLGAVGLAIGLAFQGTLSNFAAGVLLLVFRPFKVGDIVQTAGVMGKVYAIDLFTTTFDTPDNRRLIVPNNSIAGATIENVSFHAERRVEVVIGVEYAASLEKTREVLLSCAEAVSELLVEGEGRGYSVILGSLGPSSVDWKVRAWTATENYFLMQEALTEAIKRSLDRNGIGIPFPQMQLHLGSEPNLALERTRGDSRTSSAANNSTLAATNEFAADPNPDRPKVSDCRGADTSPPAVSPVPAAHFNMRRRVKPRSRQ